MSDEKQVIKAVLAYEEACRQLPSIIAELVDVHKWPMERIADFCERSPGHILNISVGNRQASPSVALDIARALRTAKATRSAIEKAWSEVDE